MRKDGYPHRLLQNTYDDAEWDEPDENRFEAILLYYSAQFPPDYKANCAPKKEIRPLGEKQQTKIPLMAPGTVHCVILNGKKEPQKYPRRKKDGGMHEEWLGRYVRFVQSVILLLMIPVAHAARGDWG